MALASFRSFLNTAGVATSSPLAPAVNLTDTLVDTVKVSSALSVIAADEADDKAILAATAAATAKTSADTAKTNKDTAVTAVGLTAAKTELAKVAEVSYTDIVTALGVLQADGAAPTEAHVDDLQTAWDAFKTAYDALIVAIDLADSTADLAVTSLGTASTSVDTAATGAATSKTAVDLTATKTALAETATILVDTDADLAVAGSQAGVDQVSVGIIVTVDLASVETVSKLHKLFKDIEVAGISAGYLTP